MRIKTICLAVLGLCLFISGVNAHLTPVEQEFIGLLNQYRARIGAPPVSVCPNLSAESRTWSVEMNRTKRLEHDRNRSPSAEICLAGGRDAQTALRMWQRSPGHDRIMRDPSITTVGIGEANGWWTMRGTRGVTRERTVTRERETQPSGAVVQTRTVEVRRETQRQSMFPVLRAVLRELLR